MRWASNKLGGAHGHRSAALACARGPWLVAVLCLPNASQAQTPTPASQACQVQLASSVNQGWRDTIASACAELTQRNDLDKDARVDVEPGPNNWLTLRATLRDGRTAVRHVDSADGLMLTLAALLVLPSAAPPPSTVVANPDARADAAQDTVVAKPDARADAAQDTTAALEASAQPATPTPPLPAKPEPAEPVPQPAAHTSLLHVGLSASVIGHIMGVPTYVAVGLAAGVALRLGPLLLHVVPRWEAEQASLGMRLPDFEMRCFGVAGFVGLRIWDDASGAAEAGIGMLLLAETQSYRETGPELVGTLVSGQMAAFARLLWGEQSSLRWTMGTEISLVPYRLSHETRVRDMLPPLPALGVGIVFGGHWES